MKTHKATLTILGTLLAGIIGGGLIYAASTHFLNKDTASNACKTTGRNFSVTIHDDAFSEKQINGHVCDTLTITNSDDKIRNISFGEHDKHESYDGVTEKLLKKDEKFTITFDKTGTYEVHDHLEDETQAFFTVTN